MKKQSGFTLIELMVVMAIIAILATAGLSAYTGYIKKARDTKRISDLSAINTIILSEMASSGLPPTTGTLKAKIAAANNTKNISDPLVTAAQCMPAGGGTPLVACGYKYYTCGTTGYAVLAGLESVSNKDLLTTNASGTVADTTSAYYDIGSCSAGSLSAVEDLTA